IASVAWFANAVWVIEALRKRPVDTSHDEQLAKSVKGISEASASKIRAAIDEKIVQPWERENWTKEQVNEVRRK
ncbi:hypothetical protein, partial [Vibrio parahaemolyticus]|uniref:hypothetical protein n=1 Tax=Vibrio parahaemolyticus TaxID=670 RepID=UPI0032AEC953